LFRCRAAGTQIVEGRSRLDTEHVVHDA